MKSLQALVALSLVTASLCQSSLRIQVNKKTSHPIPSTLYGYMWEDISHSGDGGLYGELLKNRAFQTVTPHTPAALDGWSAYKAATLDVTNSPAGVSKALPNSLQVKVPSGTTGAVGFQNGGYWGIKVQSGWKYTGSLYVRSDNFNGIITIQLVSASSGQVYASQTLQGVTNAWKKLPFTFQPSVNSTATNNVLRVTMDGAAASGKTVFFGMFSLFPPTYRGRENGMRIDLAEAMAATKPGLWRFPGGNNIEGNSIANRWKWNETIGPIENRPGRPGTWGYANTDGLGLMEYLNWAEDVGMEPILDIWAGMAIGNYANPSSFPIVPESQIAAYVQEAINEIQFVTGDANTNQWAKLRAQYGHPAPYKVRYIEVGNEDGFGQASYTNYRWKSFVNGIKAAFPNSGFQFISTTPGAPLNPAPTHVDSHFYEAPEAFVKRAFQYDTYSRSGPKVFVGEYAIVTSNASCTNLGAFYCGRLEYPTLQGAVAEAAMMTGFERNSDVVFASAYAPTLQHVNGSQWTPNLISFDAGIVVKSVSYYVQMMFSNNLGTDVLTTSPVPTTNVPLHWVASHDAKNKIVYLKVVNTAKATYAPTFALDFPITANSVSLTLLTAPVIGTANTIRNPNALVPKDSSITVASGATSFSYTMPASSVAVFKLKVDW